jgi:hypothetical protein
MQKAHLQVTSLRVEVQEWESGTGKSETLRNADSEERRERVEDRIDHGLYISLKSK